MWPLTRERIVDPSDAVAVEAEAADLCQALAGAGNPFIVGKRRCSPSAGRIVAGENPVIISKFPGGGQ